MAALLVTGIAAFGGFGQQKGGTLRNCQPYTDGVIEDVRVDTASMRVVSAVHACTTMSDLKKALPVIARNLEKMAKARNIEGLIQAYDATGDMFHSILAATDTGSYAFWREDLAVISDELGSAASKPERLAWVFLALPKLFLRAPSARADGLFGEGSQDMARSQREAEAAFMASLGRLMPEMAKQMGAHWYKADGTLPTKGDMHAFFSYFCAVF